MRDGRCALVAPCPRAQFSKHVTVGVLADGVRRSVRHLLTPADAPPMPVPEPPATRFATALQWLIFACSNVREAVGLAVLATLEKRMLPEGFAHIVQAAEREESAM